MNKEDLRRLIIELVKRLEDEKVLRYIYVLVNRVFCTH